MPEEIHVALIMPSISVVIPAYNEESRLQTSLASFQRSISSQSDYNLHETVIVSDGSKDGTEAKILECAQLFPQLKIRAEGYLQNRGKGFAIRTGIKKATGEWVLIADADGATPWSEITPFARETNRDPIDCLMGSRAVKDSVIMHHQNICREYAGRTFNLLVRTLTGLPYRDTQCGFKFVRKHYADLYAEHATEDRFAWDLDFLMILRAKGARIVERGVHWSHIGGSKVNTVRDGLQMVISAFRLRLRRLVSSI